jgi:hypothetical protein
MNNRDDMQLRTPNLGARRGFLSDWITQRWVQVSGRRIDLLSNEWLRGPVGDLEVIGCDYFRRLASRNGLEVDDHTGSRGLLARVSDLRGRTCDPGILRPEVVAFYERTSDYDFDVWSEWSPLFRPFGGLLAMIFSRRLEQLNVPLSPLDSSRGFHSTVLKLKDSNGTVLHTAWVRTLLSTGKTLYAGDYSTCSIPLDGCSCVKVCFPLPNGNATVVMRPYSSEDGSLTLQSAGSKFGDAGFYFFVASSDHQGWARYVRSLKEDIRVYVDAHGVVRADHTLSLWGLRFLRLHYRMLKRAG